MAQSIIWDKEVVEQIVAVGEYLFEQFGQSVAEKFVQDVFGQAQRLTKYPESGRPSLLDGRIRYIFIAKSRRHRLYYRVHGSSVRVIFLFDTKQDPASDPFQ